MAYGNHTPGPWTTASRTGEDVPATTRREREDGTVFYSAQVYSQSDAETAPASANGDTREQAQANARLIAAAPELLQEAENVLREYGHMMEAHDVEYLEDVIRKARREPNDE